MQTKEELSTATTEVNSVFNDLSLQSLATMMNNIEIKVKKYINTNSNRSQNHKKDIVVSMRFVPIQASNVATKLRVNSIM